MSEIELDTQLSQILTLYSEEVTQRVNQAAEEKIKKLAVLTRKSAPVGYRGKFRKAIASKCKEKRAWGNTYVWYVKAPEHRLTHLLVHGHATRNGGRTKGNPFLQNALDQVLPEFEQAVKEAVQVD